MCIELLRGEPIDTEYKNKKFSSSRTELEKRVPTLLNRALSPMLIEFNRRAESDLTSSEILKRLEDFETHSDVYFGEYNEGKAQIARVQVDPRLGHIYTPQELVNYNARQIISNHYQFHKRNDVRILKEIVFVDPSPTRVETYGITHLQMGAIITPVGDYGFSFARDSLRTTQILLDYAAHRFADTSREVYHSAPTLLKEQAARVKNARSEKTTEELGALNGFLEGILSFHQLSSTLLATKIPGVRDGAAALNLFVTSGATPLGLPSEITMQYPMGVVGPSSLSGYVPRAPLILDRLTGELITTAEFKKMFEQLCAKAEKIGICPMSAMLRGGTTQMPSNMHKTGIQVVAEMYLRIFKEVHAESVRKEQR